MEKKNGYYWGRSAPTKKGLRDNTVLQGGGIVVVILLRFCVPGGKKNGKKGIRPGLLPFLKNQVRGWGLRLP